MTTPCTTFLVVPAFSDQADQLRIVSRRARCPLTLADYRRAPDEWREAGLVAAQSGTLVCLDAPLPVQADFLACEPIRASLTVLQYDTVAA